MSGGGGTGPAGRARGGRFPRGVRQARGRGQGGQVLTLARQGPPYRGALLAAVAPRPQSAWYFAAAFGNSVLGHSWCTLSLLK